MAVGACFVIFHMLERTVLPLITLTLLELVADLVPLSTLLRPSSAGRTFPSLASITLGRSGLGVFWTSGLVFLSYSVPILPSTFPIN